MSTHCIIMPLYNDWQSASILIRKIDHEVAGWESQVTVVMVNDGSQEKMPSPEELIGDCPHIKEVCVIDLVCNQGHQRAIAVGLAYSQQQKGFDSVFVMDSDGEDPPHELNDLRIAAVHNKKAIITANRASRSEGPLFRFCYLCYKILFLLLTGTEIRFGNFCHIPARQLDRLVHYPDLWNSLSGCIKKSGLPIVGISSHRGIRYTGPSKMNFIALVLHGLSAISVLKDAVMVRLMIFFTSLCFIFGLGWVAALLLSCGEPGLQFTSPCFWLPMLFFFSLLALFLLTMFILNQLNNRAHHMKGPAFFWEDYVKNVVPVK